MIRDCRADRAEGWSYFVTQYVPVMRKIAAHYFPERAADETVLQILATVRQPQAGLFETAEPSPERWFVAELRQRMLTVAGWGSTQPEIQLDLEVLTRALEPLTVVEKQAAWLETMLYAPAETGVLLRMDPRTVEKIRGKAGERLRAETDSWNRQVLADNGADLGKAAAAGKTKECLPPKTFLDVLDGRSTWAGREEMERHISGCWHCIDHFCRLAEVVELMRGGNPLPEKEAAAFRAGLGLPGPAKSGWKRWLGA
jgi:hypothetical protein